MQGMHKQSIRWCWQPLLVQLVDEESVEEVTLRITIKLAQLDITLL